jgi:GxxExxY protein
MLAKLLSEETTNKTNCTNSDAIGAVEEKVIFREESFQIMGACFEVYNELGSGFLEAVYQEALSLELRDRLIPYLDQQALQLKYKSYQLQTPYKPDYICFAKIILEIKAVRRLTDEHRSQVHNYLKATGFKLGLLVNFGQHPKVVHERIVR